MVSILAGEPSDWLSLLNHLGLPHHLGLPLKSMV